MLDNLARGGCSGVVRDDIDGVSGVAREGERVVLHARRTTEITQDDNGCAFPFRRRHRRAVWVGARARVQFASRARAATAGAAQSIDSATNSAVCDELVFEFG